MSRLLPYGYKTAVNEHVQLIATATLTFLKWHSNAINMHYVLLLHTKLFGSCYVLFIRVRYANDIRIFDQE